jgi:hypothetical protein
MSDNTCKKNIKCENSNKKKNHKKHKHSIKNEYSKVVSENIVRIISNSIPCYVKTVIGSYYTFIHWIIAILGLLVLLFSNNLLYLSILLLIIVLDTLAIIFLHDCPLTMLEKKYLGTSTVAARRFALKNMGILFTCDHEYESQLELLINMCTIVAVKMFVIICCDIFYFHIQSV